jgi:transcription elongation factor Elf1
VNIDQDRTCPKCGAVEPVSIDLIEHVLSEGGQDVWLCWKCAIERELAIPEVQR